MKEKTVGEEIIESLIEFSKALENNDLSQFKITKLCKCGGEVINWVCTYCKKDFNDANSRR